MAGGAPFGMHTPPDSLPSSPTGAFSPFGTFPLSPLSPVDSESSLSPMRPSYRTSLLPRCQARQIGMPPTTLPAAEVTSVGSLFADPRWTGINPLFGMWSEPTGYEYMQQQGLAQLLSGKNWSFCHCWFSTQHNYVAYLVTRTFRSEHITPILSDLYFLPVR